MKQFNPDNERIKRKYHEWLKEGEGYFTSTIDQTLRSVSLWEEYTDREDFGKLDTETIKAFKKMLQEKINIITKQPLTLTTQHHHLLHLHDFYKWLSMQPGYKSKIILSDLAYFRLDRKQTRIALNQPTRRFPTPEIIKKVIYSIVPKNEIDQRDRAMIAFAFLSGMRIDALASLPLGCVNMDEMRVLQDPKQGVRTKFGKRIPTILFAFDEDSIEIVRGWIRFLREEKFFTDIDPLFPPTKIEQENGSYSFAATGLERTFWTGSGPARKIFKKRFNEAGMEYFNPHSFRRATANTAFALCKTPSDAKAVSQNLGHQNMATTMFDYIELPEDEVARHIRQLTHKEPQDIDGIVRKALKDFGIAPGNNG
jgi:integrase